MSRKLAATLGLAALSPFVAEVLLGEQFLGGRPPSLIQIPTYLMCLLFYGSAALLIREFARRTGRGWPTIVGCALAFGVFEEGLVTQSLFNPDYFGIHLLAQGYVPALGIGIPWTLYVLTLHTVWSISVPIAIVERAAPAGPWLRRRGLVVAAVLMVLGAAATFVLNYLPSPFLAAPGQFAGAAAVAVVLVAATYALTRPRTRAHPAARRVHPLALVVAGAAVSTAFELVRGSDLPTAPLCVLLLVCTVGAALVITWLARTTTWGSGQAFGLAAGAALTYCWYGLTVAAGSGTGALVEQGVLVLGTVAGLAVLGARTGTWRREHPARPADATARPAVTTPGVPGGR